MEQPRIIKVITEPEQLERLLYEKNVFPNDFYQNGQLLIKEGTPIDNGLKLILLYKLDRKMDISIGAPKGISAEHRANKVFSTSVSQSQRTLSRILETTFPEEWEKELQDELSEEITEGSTLVNNKIELGEKGKKIADLLTKDLEGYIESSEATKELLNIGSTLMSSYIQRKIPVTTLIDIIMGTEGYSIRDVNFFPHQMAKITAVRYYSADFVHIHSLNVAKFAVMIAAVMNTYNKYMIGVDKQFLLSDVFIHSVCHDAGKIHPEIFNVFYDTNNWRENADGKEMFKKAKQHTQFGKEMIKLWPVSKNVVSRLAESAKYHHEKYDGSGYYKLVGNDIDDITALIKIADVVDAITASRPYERDYNPKDSVNMLKLIISEIFGAANEDVIYKRIKDLYSDILKGRNNLYTKEELSDKYLAPMLVCAALRFNKFASIVNEPKNK
ncbi:HD-GYP domain-containing protein [Candidatus Magnetoovum chiemensis]|nr:HD-GYP domain-containing protein [Candidatus Magnetoovum chiemensis]